MTAAAHPLRQFARTKQPARSRRPTRHQPPAGSLQFAVFSLQFPSRLSCFRRRRDHHRVRRCARSHSGERLDKREELGGIYRFR